MKTSWWGHGSPGLWMGTASFCCDCSTKLIPISLSSIMLLTLFPVSLIAVCSCLLSPTSIQHIYLALSCPLPWMHSPCWTHLWIIFDVVLNMEIKEKTMSSAGCVVWIFMREPARKLNRSDERASQWGWQLTRAHSAAHPWLPAASQQSGSCVSDRVAASLPGQHKKRSCSHFSASLLFLPSPADQF